MKDVKAASHLCCTSDCENYQPLVVLEFDTSAKSASIEWLLAKLQSSKIDNGGNLIVRSLRQQGNKETTFLVAASDEHLMLAAELQGMKKLHSDGFYHEVTTQDFDNFEGHEDISSFFTQAQKQKLIYKEIENIRAAECDSHIPGYSNVKLYPGKSIIKMYLNHQIVTQIYPLHDQETIKRLGHDWYSPYQVLNYQPIGKICDYFGEKMALYFAFLGHYSLSLIPPALIGIIYFVTSWHSVYREAIFAIFNLIWTTVFLEVWKRYCAELTYTWGTIDTAVSRFEEPRADYHGSLGRNPVTGKLEPVYPKWKRLMRFYCVTVPVISVCLWSAFLVMLLYFWMQHLVDGLYEGDKSWLYLALVYMPTVVYALVIGVLNGMYRKVAMVLNDFENHRLQTSYENHLVMKLILFNFVNCFICLFYVAFYLQDRRILKNFLSTVLVTQQVVDQVREVVIPFLLQRHSRSRMTESSADLQQPAHGDSHEGVRSTMSRQIMTEGSMNKYESTIDDYLELFLQFGYVYLFSSSFPLAALWALLNNITEVRCDAFKMCRIFQRPFSQSVSSIGVWQVAFEALGVMSVMTNCTLIGMDAEVQKLLPSSISAVNTVLIFVAVEHSILAVKAVIAYIIPDSPGWVQIKLAHMEFKSRRALQKEHISTANRRKAILKKAFCKPAKSTTL